MQVSWLLLLVFGIIDSCLFHLILVILYFANRTYVKYVIKPFTKVSKSEKQNNLNCKASSFTKTFQPLPGIYFQDTQYYFLGFKQCGSGLPEASL